MTESATNPSYTLSEFTTIGDRIWRAIAEPEAVTIGLVAGDSGALLIDTGSHPDQGAAIRAAAEQVAGVPVTHVVVTHAHHDHLFGLGGIDRDDTDGTHNTVVSVAHESVIDLLTAPDEGLTTAAEQHGLDPAALAVPNQSMVALKALDVGGRRVEVLNTGRGHTEGDVVVVVPDADVVFVGDLVEQATPPWYGPDSYPQDWPGSLDGVIGLLSERSTVVVGHGDPVDREFVLQTRSQIAAVAYEIEQLIQRGVSLDKAETEGNWAHPYEHVRGGVEADWARAADRGIRGTRPTLPVVD